MTQADKPRIQKQVVASSRRDFLYTVFGGALAAIAGWISGSLSGRVAGPEDGDPNLDLAVARISTLEAGVGRHDEMVLQAGATQPLAQLEGEFNERVVFHKSELTITNPDGVLLNLVATNGHVGIRFYKDFDFGNEQVTSPWHMGYIEGNKGYQSLAILRDWRFTAALWDEDGRLTLGRLDPHPPANAPAKARVHVRGTLDEIQTIVEASSDQTMDIFQVVGRQAAPHLAVDSSGTIVLGSQDHPNALVLHDTQDGSAYLLKVTSGRLELVKI